MVSASVKKTSQSQKLEFLFEVFSNQQEVVDLASIVKFAEIFSAPLPKDLKKPLDLSTFVHLFNKVDLSLFV